MFFLRRDKHGQRLNDKKQKYRIRNKKRLFSVPFRQLPRKIFKTSFCNVTKLSTLPFFLIVRYQVRFLSFVFFLCHRTLINEARNKIDNPRWGLARLRSLVARKTQEILYANQTKFYCLRLVAQFNDSDCSLWMSRAYCLMKMLERSEYETVELWSKHTTSFFPT